MKHIAPPLQPVRTRFLLEHPAHFSVATLESNEMDRDDSLAPLAKIPRKEDRIRFKQDRGGFYTNVMFVISRETEENEAETVFLSQTSSGMLPGMMSISDVYHDYFDTSGNLINYPLNPENEEESGTEELQRRIKEEPKQQNSIQLGNTTFVRIRKIPSGIRILKPNNKGICNVQYIYAR